MSASTSRRTWEEASSPGATRLARKFEADWRAARPGSRPNPDDYLPPEPGSCPGARLALLRADMNLRREAGEPVRAEQYRRRYPDLSEESFVALVYEEFCLREDEGEAPDPAEYEIQYPEVAPALRRVFDIHGLVGSTPPTITHAAPAASGTVPLPEAGQTIAGFHLVEELGRGSFARVFRAEERQLADRPVALKVARDGSREPNTLARLQHTHIVPVHSYRIDPATGLHLLCMPYLGGVTLARLLSDDGVRRGRTGRSLLAALDRLEPAPDMPVGQGTARRQLERSSYVGAIAWWGARLAEALQHAHERGVLHRDVKPSNVLVTADGSPMLLDFNLAWESRLDHPELEPGVLGGTLAYMAPEHLEALADGVAGTVEAQSDIYALGVVLYETMGDRPFAPPGKAGSISDSLLRAADVRRAGPPRLRRDHPEVPAEFEAVVARCLAPDPESRYRTAADLAVDLQAIADDAPLRFARVPMPRRLVRWGKRNRLGIAVALPIVLALASVVVGFRQVEQARSRRAVEVRGWIDAGRQSVARERLDLAAKQFETASQLAENWRGAELRELYGEAREQYHLAKDKWQVRDQAEAVFARADGLRFRLLELGGDRNRAFRELESLLGSFFVMESATGPWTNLAQLRELDDGRRERLIGEVNDLMFLWAAALAGPGTRDAQARARAVAICDRALEFATPPGPWRALRELCAGRADASASWARMHPAGETSARACFQWAVLCVRVGRPQAATAWLERAVWLKPDDFWAEFFLGYTYEKLGRNLDLALPPFQAAVALRPNSSWAHTGRANLYIRAGAWTRAREDLNAALAVARGPEVALNRLNLAYVDQCTGRLASARAAYDAVIRGRDSDDVYRRAARLNLAKLEADTGHPDRALSAYDTLIARSPDDASARLGRALVSLRSGRAGQALEDLDRLLAAAPGDVELRSHRALALLELGRPRDAAVEVERVLRSGATPARLRLRARVELALGNVGGLSPDDPEELLRLPGDPRAVTALLNDALGRWKSSGPAATPGALLTRAVLLSALARHAEAIAEAARALALEPRSARALLVSGRIRLRAGDRTGALEDVERGLHLEPSNARLLTLRGRIEAAAGRYDAALRDLDRALDLRPEASSLAARAEVLSALGRSDASVHSWSRAIEADPVNPGSYLGRARAYRRLGRLEESAADLESAAIWSGDRPALLGPIVLEYARLLPANPSRFPRMLGLTLGGLSRGATPQSGRVAR